MKVSVLGCGGSGGVPLIGGIWGDCSPDEPKNKRMRASIMVQTDTTTVVVDTTPDFRQQMLQHEVKSLDAVLYTHAHADHLHGIDDLRSWNFIMDRRIPVYAEQKCLDQIVDRFGYVFRRVDANESLYEPIAEAVPVNGAFRVGDLEVVPFEQDHGFTGTTLGYRFGSLAYSTDVVGLSDAAFEALEDLDLWIVDSLRDEPHPTHSHFAQTMQWIERVRPRHVWLTHMNHSVDYNALKSKCPPGVEPAYDGLAMELA